MKISEENILGVGILVAFFLPVIGIIFRTGFLGYDSYYFLKQVCGGNPLFNETINPLANMVLSVLPCDVLFIKVILILFFWASMLAIYAIGSLFGKKEAIILTIFAGITPIIINNSFKFENDSFAFPIMFFGVYFFLKYLLNEKKNKLNLLASIGLIGTATLFWGGAIYYIIAFTLAEPILLLLTIPILFLFGPLLLTQIIPRLEIAENHPVKGMMSFMFYMVFIMFGSGKKIVDFYFPVITILFILLGLINPKFMILGVPFYALAILKIWQSATPSNKKRILGLAITLNLAWGLTLFFHTTQPYYSEIVATEEIVNYSQDFNLQIANDWGYGHMILYNGGETNYHSSYSDYNFFESPQTLILTREQLNCEIIQEYDKPIIQAGLNLYKC